MMISPPYLQPGDTVAIVSPAKKISAGRIENAVKILSSWGLNVITGKHVLGSSNYFSGTDEERAADFQEMLDDQNVKAIFCARGGYGSVRIIDRLNFESFTNNPKWIVGYSDITVFHSHINHVLGIETVHAPMPLDYTTENTSTDVSLLALKKALFGDELHYTVNHHPLNRTGDAQGELTGGNLSVLISLLASKSDIDTTGKILFLEDVGESMYHLDRMMQALKRSGKLSELKGLLVGNLTNFSDNSDQYAFTKAAEEIIREAVDAFSYPVAFNLPAGHDKGSVSLILGRIIQMNVQPKNTLAGFLKHTKPKGKNSVIKRILTSAFSILTLFAVIYLLYYLAIMFLI